jgi:hypothetical protein
MVVPSAHRKQGYHVQVTARSDADLTPEKIVQKVSDASGAKYSGGPNMTSAGGPPPVTARKPAFTPTQVGGGGAGFNPLGARSRAPAPSGNTDQDGWGADAPPVTRSQLEKVESAYRPTRVNMAELTSQKPGQSQNTPPDVVRGAYQPVGKVDIAALRQQAKSSGYDERPAPVKGAYEPIGKVDIAAIRAKAQGGPPSAASPAPDRSPAATSASNRDDEDEAPKSLAERSAAFHQSERLTSMPKPKVANKFGGASTFTGTKAPTPVGFGSQPVAPAAQVGAASKTFADEGGKTPAQLWAEKKAAQGGAVKSSTTGGSAAPTMPSQTTGEGGWKSGYTGKSWGAVQTTHTGNASNLSAQRTGEEPAQDDEPPSSAGGIGSLKDRFAGAAPMGAPSQHKAPAPPSMDMSSKPNAGARGVPMPGLPRRPAEPEEEEEEDVPAVQHQRLPSPPRQARSPSPEPSGSPVRIAMPVSRGRAPEELSPAEEKAPPMPARSLEQAVHNTRDMSPEPQVEARDPARAAGVAAAAATFGAGAAIAAGVAAGASAGSGGGGKRAIVEYDYEKAEDNEVELREGEYVTHIDMVDDDWWMGTNSRGESGLFPSNYVNLVEDDDEDGAEEAAPPLPPHPAAAHEPEPAAGPPQPEGGAGATATALYDYEAAEENELSFPEGATIQDVVSGVYVPSFV